MFCDLVGSTALASRLDPEDLREVIGSYHRCVAETVESFGGFAARYMGDGVLIYFRYPQAHEDDAERAIRCGLATVDRDVLADIYGFFSFNYTHLSCIDRVFARRRRLEDPIFGEHADACNPLHTLTAKCWHYEGLRKSTR